HKLPPPPRRGTWLTRALDSRPPRFRIVSAGGTDSKVRIDFVLKRVFMLLVLVWVAATLNFIGPRLTGKDPVRTRLLKQAVVGGYVQQGMEEMAKEYERKFGLDRPLWAQYTTYLGDMSRVNFGPSITNYPRTAIAVGSRGRRWRQRCARGSSSWRSISTLVSTSNT